MFGHHLEQKITACEAPFRAVITADCVEVDLFALCDLGFAFTVLTASSGYQLQTGRL